MFIVIINWCYILLTIFPLGYAFSYFVEKRLHYKIKSVDAILVAGLVIATVYAQLFSLFYKVGLLANAVLLGACLLLLIWLRKRIWKDIKAWSCMYSVAGKLVVLLLFAAWAYFTSRGYIHYDSDLYHGQSIRWIEEYGIVKGLGNLHERFAYNSASFALTALYSMKFLLGHSLHTISGFFAFVLSLTAMKLADTWKRKKMLLSDYARIAAVYYLTTIWDEVVSPASDYCIMCMIFYIVIKWLDVLETEEIKDCVVPYALLCVAGCYAVSLKLTAGLISLLVIKPAYLLLKGKRIKEIFLYLAMGLAVVLPWIARTVIISGWLLYPFTALDIFSVDWKMDAGRIALDSANIKTWGRALYNASLKDLPVTQWFPNWFGTTLSATEKLLILGNIACIIIVIGIAVLILVKKRWEKLDTLLVLVTMLCSYLFWQLSAPLMRYGYAYVLLLDALVAGTFVMAIGRDRILYYLILLYGIYKLFMAGKYIYDTRLLPYYFWQCSYGTYELQTEEIGGETFYIPVYGDRVGYDSFPAVPDLSGVELRGDGLEDGFLHR